MANGIKAYLFDLGNVVVDIYPEKFFSELELDRKIDTKGIIEKFRMSGLGHDLESGKITFDGFYERACELFGFEIDAGRFRKAWNAIIGYEKRGIYQLIQFCAEKGPVYLLSNTNEPHYLDSLNKAPSLALMKEHLLSYKLGVMKPDPSIYQETIDRLGIPAGEIFFTDDREENIESARRSGICAVRFTGVDQLRDILKSLVT